MRAVRTIVLKEWAEVFRNRVVLLTVAILPSSFLALALGTFWFAHGAMSADDELARLSRESEELPAAFVAACEGMSELQCLEGYLATVYLLLFLVMPVLLPNSFAAYSVVGEKVSRTLEPLLATPVHTWELLLAKAIAAALPAVVVTWGAAGIYLAALPSLIDPAAAQMVLAPHWIAAVVLLSPLLSLFSTLIALMVSSLAKEPRTAEMTAGLVVTPVLVVIIGQMAGVALFDAKLVVLAIGVMAALDLGLAWLAVQVFDRENILTRWR